MSFFKEKIDTLSTGEFKKPHKYVALLSMIIFLKQQEFKENKIFFNDEFKRIFSFIFQKFSKETDKNRPHTPFFHLKSSGLVFLIPNSGYDLSAINTVGSSGELNKYVSYAMLLPELFISLKNTQTQKEIVKEINDNLYEYNSRNKDNSPETKNNFFLKYLNTLQRIHGGNENALAEFQARNPFFAHIAASHPLEKLLIQDLREGKHCVILTGHAGDGKTTLAFAVYRALLGLAPAQPVAELGDSRIRFSIDGHEALLIKDLSEQEHSQHAALMADLLDTGKRGLLVSNTGALCEFFLSQTAQEKRVEVESALLESLSREQDDSFTFKGRTFKIYNLALRDNLPLAQTVLN